MKAQLRIIATLAVFVPVSIGIASGQDDPDDSAQDQRQMESSKQERILCSSRRSLGDR